MTYQPSGQSFTCQPVNICVLVRIWLLHRQNKERKPANTALHVRTLAGTFLARGFCPCLGSARPAVCRALWAVATTGKLHVGGRFTLHTDVQSVPQRRAQAAASAHRITALRPHRHTARERDWTVRTCSDPRDGMAWHGSTIRSMEHRRRTPLSI